MVMWLAGTGMDLPGLGMEVQLKIIYLGIMIVAPQL